MSDVSPVPAQAPHPVRCEKGGKHTPATREGKLNGSVLKYKICTKCEKSLA